MAAKGSTGGSGTSSPVGVGGNPFGGASGWLSNTNAGNGATAGSGTTTLKTITATADQHWLAVGEGTQSAAQLTLVGIGDDRHITLYPLPPWDSQAVATTTTPVFSNGGDRFCYTSFNAGVTRVWTVALSSRGAVVQESRLPVGVAPAVYQCETWHSSTLFSLHSRYDPVTRTDAPPTQSTVFLSTDPNEPLPPPDAPIDNRSPDGRWAFKYTNLPDALGGAWLHLWSVSPQGIPEREVETFASGQTIWSPNSQRLAVITSQGNGTLLTVYELSPQGQWEVIDTRGSAVRLYSYAGFSPNNRSLELTGLNEVLPISNPDWDENVFVRDVQSHTEFDTGSTHMMLWDSLGNLVDAPSVAPAVPTDLTVKSLELCQGIEQLGPLEVCGSPADATFIVARKSDTGTALDLLDCSGVAIQTTHLVPGVAGDGQVITTYVQSYSYKQQASFLYVGNPTYFYFTFNGAKLRHAIRLVDFFGKDYAALDSAPGGIGLLAESVKKSDYAWLYLDEDTPGPMVSFPRRINNPRFYLPEVW